MLLFRADPFGGTHEPLPCGLLGGVLVELFRKSNSKYYWYDFTVRGERYRVDQGDQRNESAKGRRSQTRCHYEGQRPARQETAHAS